MAGETPAPQALLRYGCRTEVMGVPDRANTRFAPRRLPRQGEHTVRPYDSISV
jgi:hypothetical protein